MFLTPFSSKTVTMRPSNPGGSIAFSALYQHLLYFVARSNQFGPVQHAWHIDSIMNGMAYCTTSISDFDKGGCVIQMEWTKAVCDNCQPML